MARNAVRDPAMLRSRRDNARCREKARDHPSAVIVPLRRRRLRANSFPPGQHIGMRDDENRRGNIKPIIGLAIHMNDIDTIGVDETDEPGAALCEIRSALRHPFEAVIALDQRYVVQSADFVAVRPARTRPHFR